jgi:eukaryotic-like serine/threonine-protein kinase
MRSAPSILGVVGDYELLSVLHASEAIEIYEARRRGVHGFAKPVALKRLNPSVGGNPEFLHRFCEEARLQGVVNHPNLVGLIDFGETAQGLYLVQELVSGLSLEKLASSLANRRRRAALGPVLYVAREVLRALDYIHTLTDETGRALGLVHGAMNPEAIMIGSSGQVKLGELGASCESIHQHEASWTKYAAPERVRGQRFDGRADVYALGAILTELFSGNRIESSLALGKSEPVPLLAQLGRHLTHLPPEVSAILSRALEPDRLRRYGSAREMARAVEQVARHLGVEANAYAMIEWLTDQGILAVKSGIRSSDPEVPVPASQKPPLPSAFPPSAFDTPTAVRSDVVYRLDRGAALDTADILGHLATAVLSADARVSRNGGPLLPIAMMPELARVGAGLMYRYADPVELMASECHVISRPALTRLLYAFAGERKTCLLVARDGRLQRRFFLQDGVVAASSSTVPSDLLGARLVRVGLTTESVVRKSLREVAHSGKRLGEVLTSAGVISESTLNRELLCQTEERLLGLLGQTSGELYVLPALRLDPAEFHSMTSPMRLMTRVALATHSVDEMGQALFPLWNSPLTWSSVGRERHAELGLDAEASETLGRCGTGESVGSLVAHNPGRAEAIVRAAFIGIVSQMLIVRG